MLFNCSIEPSLSLHVLNNIDTLNKANTDKKIVVTFSLMNAYNLNVSIPLKMCVIHITKQTFFFYIFLNHHYIYIIRCVLYEH